MGLFDKMLGRDADHHLKRADKALAAGDARRALDLAHKATGATSPADALRAKEMVAKARRAIFDQCCEAASRAEDSTYWDDADEWLRDALAHCDDASLRPGIEQRLADVERQAEAAELAAREIELEATAAPAIDADEVEFDGDLDLDDEHMQAEALLAMLTDELAKDYDRQPEGFFHAFAAINAGRAADAVPLLDDLVTSLPEESVLALERGKAHWQLGDARAAYADLDRAWRELGDIYLDRSHQNSLPGLWAEIAIGADEADQVTGRLAELAEPAQGHRDLAMPYALALIKTERLEDARDYLHDAHRQYPDSDAISHHLGLLLERLGNRRQAIDILGSSVTAACSGPTCNRRRLYPPTVRALISLYLADDNVEPVRDLMPRLNEALGGQLTGIDYRLMADYYQRIGHDEAAEKALADADRADAEQRDEPEIAGQTHRPQLQTSRAPI